MFFTDSQNKREEFKCAKNLVLQISVVLTTKTCVEDLNGLWLYFHILLSYQSDISARKQANCHSDKQAECILEGRILPFS